MLGQPISMLIPEVLGFRLVDRLPEGATATDLVLTITERLRKHGVVGKFVEFYGPGLEYLTIADRATLGNMSPEYGATIAIFPIDEMTLDYLRLTGRDDAHVGLVEAYAKEQGLFRTAASAGSGLHDDARARSVDGRAEPRRPEAAAGSRLAAAGEDQVPAGARSHAGGAEAEAATKPADKPGESGAPAVAPSAGSRRDSVRDPPGLEGLDHGSVVIAAITSCTNTSNPSVMIGAGLLARKAVERGLKVKPWVKTSLAPGSMVVTEYLQGRGPARVSRRARLQPRRLRLHDLHRQQRSAARPVSDDRQGQEPRRRVGAERQPQLRRPHPVAGARELPRVAAARRRLRARRPDEDRPDDRAARHGSRRAAGLPQGHLADRARDSGDDAAAR